MKMELLVFFMLFFSIHARMHSSRESHGSQEKTQAIPCNKVVPQANFSYSEMLGVWYNYISSANYDDVAANCFKKNYKGVFNNSLVFDESYQTDNGSIDLSVNETRVIDPTRPGIIKASKNVDLVGRNGKTYTINLPVDSVIMYSDSAIQLRVACAPVKTYYVDTTYFYYFVLVRDRNFNDLKEYLNVTNILKSLGVSLNGLVFLKNGADCTN